jgi:hypothetical protein
LLLAACSNKQQTTNQQEPRADADVRCAIYIYILPGHSAAQAQGTGPRGAAEKKITKVTYICRSAKKKVVTYLFYFLFLFFYRFFFKAFFGRFVTRGVQKHEKNFFSEKVHLGSSQKRRLFFPPFFFFYPRLFCSIFF